MKMGWYYNIYLVCAYLEGFFMIHNSQTPYYNICIFIIYLFNLGLEGFLSFPETPYYYMYELSPPLMRPLFWSMFWNAFWSSNMF